MYMYVYMYVYIGGGGWVLGVSASVGFRLINI